MLCTRSGMTGSCCSCLSSSGMLSAVIGGEGLGFLRALPDDFLGTGTIVVPWDVLFSTYPTGGPSPLMVLPVCGCMSNLLGVLDTLLPLDSPCPAVVDVLFTGFLIIISG